MESNKRICQICLEKEKRQKFLPIFNDRSEVGVLIFLVSGVEVPENIENPPVICRKCVKDLNHADVFRKKCIKADEYFRFSVVSEKNTFEEIYGLINNEHKHLDVIQFDDSSEDTSKKAKLDNYLWNGKDRQLKRKIRNFCSKCFKSFSDRNYLKKHEYFRHSQISIDDLFMCDYCGHLSKTKQLIRNHIITVHPTKPREKFICGVCGKMLSTKGNLNGHEKTHIEVDPSNYIKCPICYKAFREKRFMIEHKKLVHEKSKAFQCLHCSHVSTCKGAYNKHFKSVHLKLKDFVCLNCECKFSTNSQLTRHIRIHTGERPYSCQHCIKLFRLSSHRKRHEDICPKRFDAEKT